MPSFLPFPLPTRGGGQATDEGCQGKGKEKLAEAHRSLHIAGHRVGRAVQTHTGRRNPKTVVEGWRCASRALSSHAWTKRPIAFGNAEREGEEGKEYQGCGPNGGKRRKREAEEETAFSAGERTVEAVGQKKAPEPAERGEMFFGFFVLRIGAPFSLSTSEPEGEFFSFFFCLVCVCDSKWGRHMSFFFALVPFFVLFCFPSGMHFGETDREWMEKEESSETKTSSFVFFVVCFGGEGREQRRVCFSCRVPCIPFPSSV